MDAIFPLFVMAVGFWGVLRFGRRPLTQRELNVAERPTVQTAGLALLLRGVDRAAGQLGVRIALTLIFLGIFAIGTLSLVRSALR
jgi:hypothetical protein